MIPNTEDKRCLTTEERDALARFVRLEISVKQLCVQLHGLLEVDFGQEKRHLTSHFAFPEPGVRVRKEDIRIALDMHWKGEISEKELAEWATMLILNDAFEWSGPDETEIADLLNELSMTHYDES